MLRMTLRIDQSLYRVILRSAATKNLKLNHYPYGQAVSVLNEPRMAFLRIEIEIFYCFFHHLSLNGSSL